MTVLQMNQISKTYGKAVIVDHFNLQMERSHICGLIGPNGAGKTTIMRMLAGLILPSSGEMHFFGSDQLDCQRKRMSFMIEAPFLDGQMTAYENLAYIRYMRGYPDEKRIDELLDLTGRADAGKKKVEKFSLGMRQRLGIAMALLTKPEVLVLDEPVNGLDPEGIVEIRQILTRLSDEQNVSILISSHLLSELSELCTDFVILHHGKMIDHLIREALMVKCRGHISVRTNDSNRTAAVLEQMLSIRDYKVLHNGEIHIFEQLDQLDAISQAITGSGLILRKFCEEGETLEAYYLKRVGEQHDRDEYSGSSRVLPTSSLCK